MDIGKSKTIAYSFGEKNLEFHSSNQCGCTICWSQIGGNEVSRMAVNLRLAAPEVVAKVKIRHFDGADSREFLD